MSKNTEELKMNKASKLTNILNNKELDTTLADIYGVDNDFAEMEIIRARYINVLQGYIEKFGSDNDVELFSAPGRTEIAGNHTDHQGGKVLCGAVDLDMIAAVCKREDSKVVLISEGYESIEVDINDLENNDNEKGTTTALIKGVCSYLKSHDYALGGFNAYVTSNVPAGSGLSSSAAFETLIGTIVSGLFNDMTISAETIAIAGKYAENEYFGKPSGLMDQMACSVGGLVEIDFKNSEHPVIEKLTQDITKLGYTLCIVDTKGSHADLTDEYAAVPKEMKRIASYFGEEVLSRVSNEEFLKAIPELRDAHGDKTGDKADYKTSDGAGDRAILRALHFFEETERAEKEYEALVDGDMDEFLKIYKASADSSYRFLQNIYSVKDPKHQEMAIGIALSENFLGDDGCVRVHGGGFAGTIQVFVRNEKYASYKEYIESIFGEGSCHRIRIRKYGGVKVTGDVVNS